MRVNESVARLCRLSFLLFITAFIIDCLCRSTGIKAVTAAISDTTYYIRPFIGSGGGSRKLSVDVSALEAKIGLPTSVVQSSNGDLYFASRFTYSVLKVEFNKTDGTSIVRRVAGTGIEGIGADNILATESALMFPIGVSLIEDSNGKVTAILIADISARRVRKVDMVSGKIKTVAGGGAQKNDGAQATSAELSSPHRAQYDKKTGDIFIVEYWGNRIRKVLASDGTITTVVGGCKVPGELGDDGPAIDACLNEPFSFIMNDGGELFIADYGNNRVRKMGLDGKISTIAGGGSQDGLVVRMVLRQV